VDLIPLGDVSQQRATTAETLIIGMWRGAEYDFSILRQGESSGGRQSFEDILGNPACEEEK
jgi:hypothetical protein